MPASIVVFEQVTEDAAFYTESGVIDVSQTTPENNWAGHQNRINVLSDGSIRILYTSWDNVDLYKWNVAKRDSGGSWTNEGSGQSYDDPSLLRHEPSDTSHIFAWPLSILTAYKSTDSFVSGATVLSGSWQIFGTNSSRHYSNFGIGLDGTAGIKATVEQAATYATQNTRTDYATGTYNSGTGAWSWNSAIQHTVGSRYAYDYIFPNPGGIIANGIIGVSAHDVYYRVAGYAKATDVPPGAWNPANGDYVFNGAKIWNSSLASDTYSEMILGDIPDLSPIASSSAPTVRVSDSYIDSAGRLFVIYHVQADPTATIPLGFYLSIRTGLGSQTQLINISDGITISGFRQSGGACRLHEDAVGRMWLLWAVQGPLFTYFRLYQLESSTSDGGANGNYSYRHFVKRNRGRNGGSSTTTTFNLSASYTDLNPSGSLMYDYAIQNYGLYLAVPRGGNDRTMYIDLAFNAFWKKYSDFAPGAYVNTPSVNYAGHGQRVFYVRIELPSP